MNLDDLAFLTSERGQTLLDQLAAEDLHDTLKWVTTLRKTYSQAEVSAALTQAGLRQKAVDKFRAEAAGLLFTDEALQQASDPLIRHYRAGLIRDARVVDLCCGIGTDALAFAGTNEAVIGVDLDPVRVEIARHNADALGVNNVSFVVADVRQYQTDADAAFFDPARRDESGRRIFDVNDYLPPLATIHRYSAPRKLAKISPGVDLAQLAEESVRVEFISVEGDLKEALLHYGDSGLTATRLDADGSAHHWHHRGDEPDLTLSAPRAWLIEPDSALIRAGLVRHLAESMRGALLDETIAYITADHPPDSAWARGWRVLDWMPFNLKVLRAYLRERNVGTVTVKKRGSPITLEELNAKLKLKGMDSRTLVLTRYQNQPMVIICADYTA